MEQFAQQKTLDMQRGLFLIKYESSESPANPPRVKVLADPGSEGSLEFILPPGADEAVLWSPGASLVARAVRNGRLRVVVTASKPDGSTMARVQVTSLSMDPAGANGRELATQLDLSRFRLLGHVAGRGDVIVDADNWIAGPSAPARIEGISIDWPDRPRDLMLRYAVTVGSSGPNLHFVDVGEFAGTRRRALPLVGATLEISDSAAIGHQLVVDSIFLGSPQMRASGQRVVITGPTGREPLVGLRIRIEPLAAAGTLRQQPGGHRAEMQPVGQVEEDGNVISVPPSAQNERAPVERNLVKRYVVPAADEQETPSKPANKKSPPSARRSARVRVFRSAARSASI